VLFATGSAGSDNDVEIPIRRQDPVRDTAHYVKLMRDDIDRYAAIVKKLNLQIR
jgi:hypothetical protein